MDKAHRRALTTRVRKNRSVEESVIHDSSKNTHIDIAENAVKNPDFNDEMVEFVTSSLRSSSIYQW